MKNVSFKIKGSLVDKIDKLVKEERFGNRSVFLRSALKSFLNSFDHRSLCEVIIQLEEKYYIKYKKDKRTKVITFKIACNLYKELEDISKYCHVPKSSIIRAAIHNYFDSLTTIESKGRNNYREPKIIKLYS